MSDPGITHAEADLRALLADMGELEVMQQVKDLCQRYGLAKGDVMALWRQEHRPTGKGAGPKLAGRPISELLCPAEPWPEAVDGAAWLEECEHELQRYLAMPEGAHVALAAWCLYTHAWQRFGYAPYVVFTSPAPACGKSSALRACQRLSGLPLSSGSLTTATLFRVVDAHHPVLLLDEQDGRLERNEEMRLLLNEGFQKGGVVLRCVGDDAEPRAFDCFGPKALASIGALPSTILSRSIVVPMERSQDPLEPLGPNDYPEELARLRRQGARWAADHSRGLGTLPSVPGMDGRLLDKWGPLLAVAEAAGEAWLPRVVKAAHALHFDEAEESEHIELLADVGRYFESLRRSPTEWPEFVVTESILRALNALPEARWSESGPKKDGLTSHGLARHFRNFRVKPTQEPDGQRRRGYATAPIRRACTIYCPEVFSPGVPSESVPSVPSVRDGSVPLDSNASNTSNASKGGVGENENADPDGGDPLDQLF